MDEEAKELAGSQMSIDDEWLSKKLDGISPKRKTIVPELQPRRNALMKEVIAQVEK
ncbi:hypothetical protein MKW92_025085, partial [Papaver armeniacum]